MEIKIGGGKHYLIITWKTLLYFTVEKDVHYFILTGKTLLHFTVENSGPVFPYFCVYLLNLTVLYKYVNENNFLAENRAMLPK